MVSGPEVVEVLCAGRAQAPAAEARFVRLRDGMDDRSVEASLREPDGRRRLGLLVLGGAALLDVARALAHAEVSWPNSATGQFIAVSCLGAFLGALAWLALVMRPRSLRSEVAETIRDAEAEQRRFEDLRHRAARDPEAARQYLQLMREAIAGYEELARSNRFVRRARAAGWDPLHELEAMTRELADAERRYGGHAA